MSTFAALVISFAVAACATDAADDPSTHLDVAGDLTVSSWHTDEGIASSVVDATDGTLVEISYDVEAGTAVASITSEQATRSFALDHLDGELTLPLASDIALAIWRDASERAPAAANGDDSELWSRCCWWGWTDFCGFEWEPRGVRTVCCGWCWDP